MPGYNVPILVSCRHRVLHAQGRLGYLWEVWRNFAKNAGKNKPARPTIKGGFHPHPTIELFLTDKYRNMRSPTATEWFNRVFLRCLTMLRWPIMVLPVPVLFAPIAPGQSIRLHLGAGTGSVRSPASDGVMGITMRFSWVNPLKIDWAI